MTFNTRPGSLSYLRRLPVGGRISSQPESGQIKVLHIINDLSIGGAEMMLYKLLSGMNGERFSPVVISLKDHGKLRERIKALGVPVYSLMMKQGMPNPASFWRLVRLVRKVKPDLIQGWMWHGNLVAQLASAFAPGRLAVLWSIRQSLYSLDYEKPTTAFIIKLGARLSRKPTKILYNSRTSAAQHGAIGYRLDKTLVIPNGFDAKLFAPSAEARRTVRNELGVAENTLLIGLTGSYHPKKDHSNFLHAAALLLKSYPDVQFVLSGRGINWTNHELGDLVQELGLAERIHLLGERQDMPRISAALDIATSSSYVEGFPNVIGEAMSCGVPCVVTDVSDLPWIVGETGRVVPPRDSAALARAWAELVALGPQGRKDLGEAARARVMECFSLASVVAQYEKLYESVIAEKTGQRAKDNVRFLERSQPSESKQEEGDGPKDVGRSASSRTR
jgi:glycosyltransferase involved in cell wall biosynthesis